MCGRQKSETVVTCCIFLVCFIALMTTATTACYFCLRRSAAFTSSAAAAARQRTSGNSSSLPFLKNGLGFYLPTMATLSASQQQQQQRQERQERFSSTTAAVVREQRQNNDAVTLIDESSSSSSSSSSSRNSSLTRTMVRRMKVRDLREQLQLRGFIDTAEQNRTQLVALLLDQIANNDNNNDGAAYRRITNANDSHHDATVDNSTIAVEEEEEEEPGENDAEWYYPNDNSMTTEEIIDPCRTYILRPACLSSSSSSDPAKNDGGGESLNVGSGIGLVLREVESDRVVWTAHKYLPAERSLYEASYTALVFALRWAVHRLRLPNLRVQIDQSLVLNQMVGIYRVEKETLKPMHEEAQRLKQDVGRNCSLELIQKIQNAESEDLARKALQTETSTEFDYHDDDDDDDDAEATLLLSTDPMGKDYTGPPTPIKKLSYWDNLFTAQGGADAMAEAESTQATEDSTATQKTTTAAATIDPSKKYLLKFDGGARGNPGNAGAGMALFDDTGREIWCGWKFLGECMSNNQAEYYAIVLGLQCALSLGIKRIQCQGDSELIIKQLTGQYKVKNEGLRKLWVASQTVIREFELCEMSHIGRADNERADALANTAMDEQSSFGFEEVST